MKGSGSRCVLLQSWCEAAQAIATFCVCQLHITRDLLEMARSWENVWLRRLLRFKRIVFKPSSAIEDMKSFNSRAARSINKYFIHIKKVPIHIRILRSVLSLLWSRSRLLATVQVERTGTWKCIAKSLSYKQRKENQYTQAKSGYRCVFTDIFKNIYGDDREGKLCNIEPDKQKETLKQFSIDACKYFNLPLCSLVPD